MPLPAGLATLFTYDFRPYRTRPSAGPVGGSAIAPPGGTPIGIGGFDMAGIGGTIATFRRGPGESYSDVILRIAAQK